jgi:hypothetical protein
VVLGGGEGGEGGEGGGCLLKGGDGKDRKDGGEGLVALPLRGHLKSRRGASRPFR